jgi:signal transduction histidine kinase/ActR/RegA family two-component response regulator
VVEFFTKDARLADVEIIPLFSAIGTHIGQYIERQRLEEQYRQSQKMEAVGTLAGGIAHDFNNILTAISGYCELARLELPGEHSAHTHLQAVQQGATRATELVRQIMTFSRRQEQARRPLRLEVIVKEAIQLLRATIPATIEIKSDCAPDTPRILADATSIHQVLVNLGTNASHAMKGRSGVIEINVEGVDVCADFAEAHPGLREGKFVRLTLSDTGHGMSAATISRIFEPFFTTKPPGEGTGLGLSVVHGIVQAHEGAVFVYSQPGQGTKFQLYFPAHVCSDAEKTPATPAAIPRGNGQQVLYVEDEGPLGHMGRKLLERLNYSVEVHSNPATALSAFQTDPGSYSMVVTDLTMPTMTGLELGREIIKLRPGLPMILMTGYAGSLDPEQARADGFCELLLKPLSLETLGNAVDRALRGLVASR